MALDFSDFVEAKLPLFYFEEISKIPHPSSHTEKIADYLVDFAKTHGLSYTRDAFHNVLIRKEATPGMEDAEPICFQGHTDMVAECDPDIVIDMTKEPITLWRDGDFLRARGTTLGGDDGVAVAYALAVLASNDIPHPYFEALFTSDEEIGLIGATNLDVGPLRAKYLVNIDSDGEGVFTVGCAGGVRCDMEKTVEYLPCRKHGLKITVGGGKGGHSGVEIDRGRANAVKILGELLSEARKSVPFSLSSLHGGNADNAIPAECSAIVACDDIMTMQKCLNDMFPAWIAPYKESEGELFLELEVCDVERVLCDSDAALALGAICATPVGVVAMSRDIEGLVETSLNLGSVRLGETLHLVVSVRSSKESEKDALVARLMAISKEFSLDFSTRGGYPAWEYNGRSRIIDVCESVYKKLEGQDAKTIIIHAGLECGILSTKFEGLSCISLGPDNFDIHTPRERLSLPSFTRVWKFLLEVLKSM
ncbi:MAG: beta-Ala-His dipeptidase [Clostridia bacterium]|nr:beta-Ala-His dipeptidase [Clostridia bacterium]